MTCYCAQPSPTNIWAGLCWILQCLSSVCWDEETVLPDSPWDTLAGLWVDFKWRIRVNSQMSRMIMSQQRLFSFQHKWSQTRITANCTQAITSSTFIRVRRTWGKYMDYWSKMASYQLCSCYMKEKICISFFIRFVIRIIIYCNTVGRNLF